MTDKKKIDSFKTFLIVGLLFVVGILVAILVRQPSTEEIQRQIAREMNRQAIGSGPGRDRGRGSDPYIQGPVKNTITKGFGSIQECYNAFIERSPKKTDGKVSADWQVSPEGNVESPEIIRSDLDDKKLQKCITQKINEWKFPPPPSGINKYVEFTFAFKKAEEDDKKKASKTAQKDLKKE